MNIEGRENVSQEDVAKGGAKLWLAGALPRLIDYKGRIDENMLISVIAPKGEKIDLAVILQAAQDELGFEGEVEPVKIKTFGELIDIIAAGCPDEEPTD